jgi:hypothetical protein
MRHSEAKTMGLEAGLVLEALQNQSVDISGYQAVRRPAYGF